MKRQAQALAGMQGVRAFYGLAWKTGAWASWEDMLSEEYEEVIFRVSVTMSVG